MARRLAWAKTVFLDVHRVFHNQFVPLRDRAQPWLLLLFRVLQGAFGGGLQPMAQAILGDTFPPEKRGLAFALYGVTAICAPAIGPTLGGWITDNYSWRWFSTSTFLSEF